MNTLLTPIKILTVLSFGVAGVNQLGEHYKHKQNRDLFEHQALQQFEYEQSDKSVYEKNANEIDKDKLWEDAKKEAAYMMKTGETEDYAQQIENLDLKKEVLKGFISQNQ